MASFFGEVTALSSRAVDDEPDDIELPELTVKVLDDNARNKNIKFAVFAVGNLSTAFVCSYFRSQDSKLIASAEAKTLVPKESFSGLNYFKKPVDVAQFFLSPSSNVLICEVKESIPEELNIDLCQQVLSLFPSVNECAVLATAPLSSYKNDSGCLQESRLKCLATSKYFSMYPAVSLPYLQPPNIVTNFPAAVLTQFEINGHCAVLYFVYTDVSEADPEVIRIFKAISQAPMLSDKLAINQDATARLQAYVKSQEEKVDNLYT